MRYDRPIYFQTVTQGAYDAKTGNYGDETVTEEERYASVMDTRTQTMQLIYGGVKEGSLCIQLQNAYDKAFNRIRVGEKLYCVDYRRQLRTKQTFVVSEIL